MDYLRSAAHFGVWLQARGTVLADATHSVVAEGIEATCSF